MIELFSSSAQLSRTWGRRLSISFVLPKASVTQSPVKDSFSIVFDIIWSLQLEKCVCVLNLIKCELINDTDVDKIVGTLHLKKEKPTIVTEIT